MLQPKRTKYRKVQKGRMKGVSQRGHELSNGMFGIKSLDSSFITSCNSAADRFLISDCFIINFDYASKSLATINLVLTGSF